MAGNQVSENKTTRAATAEGLSRRGFMQALGGVAAGVAVLAKPGGEARADNSWDDAVERLSDEKLIDIYTKMLRSRWWEEGIKDAFLNGKDGLYGACHLYVGQEAVAGGIMAALNEDDFIASNHRGHGHLINKGGDLNRMSAEMFYRQDGYNKGYGGSMHITDLAKGILGMNGIVGPSHILAAGAAYGIKVRGTRQVAVAFGGDGSVNNGWFYSALRNAALYELPFISVIENNGFQMSIPATETISVRDLSSIGKGLEIPSYTVDGQDVFAVYSVAREAVERARNGGGPTLIEAKTYRYYDHNGVARSKSGALGAFGLPYRSDRELKAWIAKDPLLQLKNTLMVLGVLDERQAGDLEADVKRQVQASFEFARNSPLPGETDGLAHVYAEGTVNPSQMLA
jgi:pyruvate dehydrogenase E1 component alpha subunit